MNLIREQCLFKKGYARVAGIDEAGRGPLAGPVVAACVIFKPDLSADDLEFSELKKIKDSKKLNFKTREELYKTIINECLDFGVGICDHETIDRINILQATFLAMKKALSALKQKPDYILVDGNFIIPNCSYRQEAVIAGDAAVFTIASASIIAKVARDRIMLEMHKQYPDYGFDKHKGYGTKFHTQQLKKYGPCEIHRRSFRPVRMISGK